MLTLIKNYSN